MFFLYEISYLLINQKTKNYIHLNLAMCEKELNLSKGMFTEEFLGRVLLTKKRKKKKKLRTVS